jgi:hypothetical protein
MEANVQLRTASGLSDVEQKFLMSPKLSSKPIECHRKRLARCIDNMAKLCTPIGLSVVPLQRGAHRSFPWLARLPHPEWLDLEFTSHFRWIRRRMKDAER